MVSKIQSQNFVIFPSLSIVDVLSVGLIYATPFLVISLGLPILAEGQKVESITHEFNSLKAHDDIFKALLKECPRYDVSRETSNILLGNPQAKNMLTIFTNPHCGPCSRMHVRVETLLNEVGNDFCVQYILSSFNESLDTSSEFFIHINNNKTAKERDEIYREWFSGGKDNKENIFKKYDFNIDTVSDEYGQHKKWKERTKLAATPTLIFNGIELPRDHYQNIEDLKYFTHLDIDA